MNAFSPRNNTTGAIMRRFMRPEHKAAARAVGYALTLRNDLGNQAAAFVFQHRLNTEDRAILATAILDSLTDAEFSGVIRHFCERSA